MQIAACNLLLIMIAKNPNPQKMELQKLIVLSCLQHKYSSTLHAEGAILKALQMHDKCEHFHFNTEPLWIRANSYITELKYEFHIT